MNQFARSVLAVSSILLSTGMLGELRLVPNRTLMNYAHFTEWSGVLACLPPFMEIVNTALEMKDLSAYHRLIAGRDYEARLLCIHQRYSNKSNQ
jgi:hypothetical protein